MQEIAEIVLLSKYHTQIDASSLKGNSSAVAHVAFTSNRFRVSCMQLLLTGRTYHPTGPGWYAEQWVLYAESGSAAGSFHALLAYQ